MTRTINFTATTLDGDIADEQDCLGWLFVHDINAAGPNSHEAFMESIGAIVMGRTTYEWVREHLQAAEKTWPYEMPTWVVTHAELPGIDGADIRFAQARAGRSTPRSPRPPAARTCGSWAAVTWLASSPTPDCWIS